MSRTGPIADQWRGARFQPLLLLGAVVAYLPTATGDADRRTMLLVGAGAFAVLSVGSWWWGRRATTTMVAREWLGLGLWLLTLAAYVVMTSGLERGDLVHLLPFAALLLVAAAPTPRPRLRATVQVMVVGLVGLRLVEASTPLVETALVLALLGGLSVVINAFADDLARSRRAQRRARQLVEARARLLTALGELPGKDAAAAAQVVVDTLTDLGLRDVEVVRTPVTHDGAAGTENQREVAGTGTEHRAAGTVPIEVAGAVAGVIRVDPDSLAARDAEVGELLQVVARLLGRVWEAEGRLHRQRRHHARVRELESTRRGYLDVVSTELREPLGGVRGAVRALAVGDGQPEEAMRRLSQESDRLAAMLTALLGLAVQPPAAAEELRDGEARRVTVAELLAPLVERGVLSHVDAPGGPEHAPSAHPVVVAPDLLRYGVELLLGDAGPSHGVVVRAEPDAAVVRVQLPARDCAVVGPDGADTVGAQPLQPHPLAHRLILAAGASLHDGWLVLPSAESEKQPT